MCGELHRDLRAVADDRVAYGARKVEEEGVAELIGLELVGRIPATPSRLPALRPSRERPRSRYARASSTPNRPHCTTLVTRTEGGGRLRVFTGRYMLIVRGKERGQSRVEVEETALSPADVIARVIQSAAERTGDTEPPVAVGPAVWYES